MKDFYKYYYDEALSQCSSQATDTKSLKLTARKYDWNYRRLLNGLPLDATILDYGCGIGQFLYYLRIRGHTNISGIDISEQQITIARKLHPNLLLYYSENPKEWLEKKKNSFQLITLNDVIEHIPTKDAASLLGAIYNALRPDGRLIIKTVNGAYPLGSRARYIDWTHTTAFTDRSLIQILRHAGFENIRCYQEEIGIYNPLFFIKKMGVYITRGLLRLTVYFSEADWPKIISVNIIATATKNA